MMKEEGYVVGRQWKSWLCDGESCSMEEYGESGGDGGGGAKEGFGGDDFAL